MDGYAGANRPCLQVLGLSAAPTPGYQGRAPIRHGTFRGPLSTFSTPRPVRAVADWSLAPRQRSHGARVLARGPRGWWGVRDARRGPRRPARPPRPRGGDPRRAALARPRLGRGPRSRRTAWAVPSVRAARELRRSARPAPRDRARLPVLLLARRDRPGLAGSARPLRRGASLPRHLRRALRRRGGAAIGRPTTGLALPGGGRKGPVRGSRPRPAGG